MSEPTRLPATVGVLGGGRMGAGIAQVVLQTGSTVVLVESGAEAADAAAQRVRAGLGKAAERGTLDGTVDEAAARLRTATDPEAFGGCGLVVEAVPEDPSLKGALLPAAERALDADAVLATNTSSISVGDLAAHLTRPDRFLGLHFFNPVPPSALVEIVRGEATDAALVETARGWVETLGKTPVVVRDRPGFATSRLGVALGLEAIRMLEEDVASAADIDTAMALGYRHPMGPLHLTDLVGLDVRLGIAEYLQARLGDRFAPPQLLRDKVAAGELGRKTGRGFFTWDEG
jgi:3-hydroxybutyryl-CoA dehydrogenase